MDLSDSPKRPSLSLAGASLTVTRRHRRGSPVLRWFPSRKHAVANTPVGSQVLFARSSPDKVKRHTPLRRRPSPFSGRVGSHIVLFEDCSAFTRVTAYLLAESLSRPFFIEGFDGFVTSTIAPTASGWSEYSCRVGFAPTEYQHLHGAPENSNHSVLHPTHLMHRLRENSRGQ